MSKLPFGLSTFGKLTTTQATIDLPVSSGTAAEIDVTGEMNAQITVYVAAEFYWSLADDATAAATRIASDATRMYLPSGLYSFPLIGVTQKLYIRAKGSAVTDGISYCITEAD